MTANAGPLLDVRHLTTRLRTREGIITAADDVCLAVNAGETLALVGESGSGKSMTALSLLRLIPQNRGSIDAGEVMFEGRDLLKMSLPEIQRIRGNRISMIFQEPMSSLNPVLTLGMQIAEPLRTHRSMGKREAWSVARTLLDDVRMPDAETRLGYYPHQLSGGMRQRAMIAMAIACGPRLIIADEPTTALDVTVQAQILDLLKELTLRKGSALILITHDLGLVARYADRVAVMYAGRIVESAPVAALYKRPRHPYTKVLLASMPRLDMTQEARLMQITGQPPSLARLPLGCAFAPRCASASDRCLQQRPSMVATDDTSYSACHLNG